MLRLLSKLQYSDLYSSEFIWLLQGHLPTVGLNNRQGTPKGAKKKLLNLLSPFPKYVPKYFIMTKMQKTCTKKKKCFFFSPLPSIKQCIFELRNYVIKWKEAKRTQARFARKLNYFLLFIPWIFELLQVWRFSLRKRRCGKMRVRPRYPKLRQSSRCFLVQNWCEFHRRSR